MCLGCGGIRQGEYRLTYPILDSVLSQFPISAIIHCSDSIAANLAQKVAKNNDIPTAVFELDVQKHGKGRTGIRNRNSEMFSKIIPDYVFNFTGTYDKSSLMRRTVLNHELPWYFVKENGSLYLHNPLSIWYDTAKYSVKIYRNNCHQCGKRIESNDPPNTCLLYTSPSPRDS